MRTKTVYTVFRMFGFGCGANRKYAFSFFLSLLKQRRLPFISSLSGAERWKQQWKKFMKHVEPPFTTLLYLPKDKCNEAFCVAEFHKPTGAFYKFMNTAMQMLESGCLRLSDRKILGQSYHTMHLSFWDRKPSPKCPVCEWISHLP